MFHTINLNSKPRINHPPSFTIYTHLYTMIIISTYLRGNERNKLPNGEEIYEIMREEKLEYFVNRYDLKLKMKHLPTENNKLNY